jgi:hypothetical protein
MTAATTKTMSPSKSATKEAEAAASPVVIEHRDVTQ